MLLFPRYIAFMYMLISQECNIQSYSAEINFLHPIYYRKINIKPPGML